jgi:hypothetical protein
LTTASARADEYCVGGGGCPPDHSATTVQGGLNLAGEHPGADQVHVAAGTFTETTTYTPPDGATNPVAIDGAGRGATKIVGSSYAALILGAVGSSVRDLTLVAVREGQGLVVDGNGRVSATRLEVVPAATDANDAALVQAGGTLDVQGSALTARSGVALRAIGSATADDTTFTGTTAILNSETATMTVRRSRLIALYGAYAQGGTVELSNSYVTTSPTRNASPVGLMATSGAGNTTIRARNVTVAGDGSTPSLGVSILGGGGHTARVELVNTVLTGYASSFAREAEAGSRAELVTTNSAYAPAGFDGAGPGGPVSETNPLGTPTGFVSNLDHRLRHDSPLVDAGAPIAYTVPALDVNGKPRFVDGRGDGGEQLDVGAFEYQRTPPHAAIAGPATAFTAEPVTFDASASGDDDPGEGLVFLWTVDGTVTANGPPTYRYLRPTRGGHTVSVKVTDPTGQSATATARVTVADGPPPELTAASITRSFRVGVGATPLTGRTTARAATGARIGYRLSKAATVRLAFTRARRGYRSHGRCVARRPRAGAVRRCTRYVAEGTLVRTSRAGANRVRFSGRIRQRALPVGRHRLRLRATNAAGLRSRPRTLYFRILPPVHRRTR